MTNSCPPLEPPPVIVLDTLAPVVQKNSDAGHWLISLEKHLEALDACGSH